MIAQNCKAVKKRVWLNPNFALELEKLWKMLLFGVFPQVLSLTTMLSD